MTDPRLAFSAAAARNQALILEQLIALLPSAASVLEIASGSGQHAAHCAAARPDWRWQPSDADARVLPAINARCAGLSNVRPALALDVECATWPLGTAAFDALLCVNMLHISPWASCAGLMRGGARHLRGHGRLVLYGPFFVDGVPTAPSNLAFDADLRARDARWGLRRLESVLEVAEQFGLTLDQRVQMPANNLTVVLRRAPAK